MDDTFTLLIFMGKKITLTRDSSVSAAGEIPTVGGENNWHLTQQQKWQASTFWTKCKRKKSSVNYINIKYYLPPQ